MKQSDFKRAREIDSEVSRLREEKERLSLEAKTSRFEFRFNLGELEVEDRNGGVIIVNSKAESLELIGQLMEIYGEE